MKKIFLAIALFVSSMAYSQKFDTDSIVFFNSKDNSKSVSKQPTKLNFYTARDTNFLAINKATLYATKIMFREVINEEEDIVVMLQAYSYPANKALALGLYYTKDAKLLAVAISREGFTTIFKIRTYEKQ